MIQFNLFEPHIIRQVRLTADSPKRAFYNLTMEMLRGNCCIRKESGGNGKIMDRRLWTCESYEKAEKLFERIVREKTRERKSERKYTLANVANLFGGSIKLELIMQH